MAKFQYGSVGGIRKVKKDSTAAQTATTIAGLEGQTLTLAQLQALLQSPSVVPTTPSNPGTPSSGSLSVVYPLQGGGPLVGNVSLSVQLPPPTVLLASEPDEPMLYPPGPTGVQTTSGGSPLTVEGGTTTVTNVTTLKFIGATVSTPTGGEADVTVSGGGGGFPSTAFPWGSSEMVQPPQTGWTFQDPGSNTFSFDADGTMVIQAAGAWAFLSRDITAGAAFDIKTLIAIDGNVTPALCVRDPTTGNFQSNFGGAGPQFYSSWYGLNLTTTAGAHNFGSLGYSSTEWGATSPPSPYNTANPIWLRLTYDGAGNYIARVSTTGAFWSTIFSGGWNFAASPAEVGFGVPGYSSNPGCIRVLSWSGA